ncbi:hypothetical protein [[Mycoplasma] collis]|uniref:hypothetical protein n=1 Tax=[Mycoplasma] collis TaxID=2127 RepID=UPI00051AC1AE|nr:hypothetical protein [[Mycoplasma] collis]
MPQINQTIKATNNIDTFNSFETKEHPYNINKFYLEVDNTKTETVANDKNTDNLKVKLELDQIRNKWKNKYIVAKYYYIANNGTKQYISFKKQVTDNINKVFILDYNEGDLKRNRNYQFESLELQESNGTTILNIEEQSQQDGIISNSTGGQNIENSFITSPTNTNLFELQSFAFVSESSAEVGKIELEIEDKDDVIYIPNNNDLTKLKALLALANDNNKTSIAVTISKVETNGNNKKITLEVDNPKLNEEYVLKHLKFNNSDAYKGQQSLTNNAIFGQENNYNVDSNAEKKSQISVSLESDDANSFGFELDPESGNNKNIFKITKLKLNSNVLDFSNVDNKLHILIKDIKNETTNNNLSATNQMPIAYVKINNDFTTTINNFNSTESNTWNKLFKVKTIYIGTLEQLNKAKTSSNFDNVTKLEIDDSISFESRVSDSKSSALISSVDNTDDTSVKNLTFEIETKDFNLHTMLDSNLISLNDFTIEISENNQNNKTGTVTIKKLEKVSNNKLKFTFDVTDLVENKTYKINKLYLNKSKADLKIHKKVNDDNQANDNQQYFKVPNETFKTLALATLNAQSIRDFDLTSDLKINVKVNIDDNQNILTNNDKAKYKIHYAHTSNQNNILSTIISNISTNDKYLEFDINMPNLNGAYRITKIEYIGEHNTSSWKDRAFLKNKVFYDKSYSSSNLEFGYSLGSFDTTITQGTGTNSNKITMKLQNIKSTNSNLKLIDLSQFDFYAKVKNKRSTNLQTIKGDHNTIRVNSLTNEINFQEYDANYTNNTFIIENLVIVKKGMAFNDSMFNNNSINILKIDPATKNHAIDSQLPFYMNNATYIEGDKYNDASLEVELDIYSNDGVFSTETSQMTLSTQLLKRDNSFPKRSDGAKAKIISVSNNRRQARVKLWYNPAELINSNQDPTFLDPKTTYKFTHLKFEYKTGNHTYASDTNGGMTNTNMGVNSRATEATMIHNIFLTTKDRFFIETGNYNNQGDYSRNSLVYTYWNDGYKYFYVHVDHTGKVSDIITTNFNKKQWKNAWNGKRLEVIYRARNADFGDLGTSFIWKGKIHSDTPNFNVNNGLVNKSNDYYLIELKDKAPNNTLRRWKADNGGPNNRGDRFYIQEIRLVDNNNNNSVYMIFNPVEDSTDPRHIGYVYYT